MLFIWYKKGTFACQLFPFNVITQKVKITGVFSQLGHFPADIQFPLCFITWKTYNNDAFHSSKQFI